MGCEEEVRRDRRYCAPIARSIVEWMCRHARERSLMTPHIARVLFSVYYSCAPSTFGVTTKTVAATAA
jgi:hypothetical protein